MLECEKACNITSPCVMCLLSLESSVVSFSESCLTSTVVSVSTLVLCCNLKYYDFIMTMLGLTYSKSGLQEYRSRLTVKYANTTYQPFACCCSSQHFPAIDSTVYSGLEIFSLYFYSFPLILSFRALAAENDGSLLAAISNSSPVRGLRPFLAARSLA